MFSFIYNADNESYGLWWDGFPEAMLGTMRQLCINEWECCPQWQAHFRLDLQYRTIHAEDKETAALHWLTEGQGIAGAGHFEDEEEENDD